MSSIIAEQFCNCIVVNELKVFNRKKFSRTLGRKTLATLPQYVSLQTVMRTSKHWRQTRSQESKSLLTLSNTHRKQALIYYHINTIAATSNLNIVQVSGTVLPSHALLLERRRGRGCSMESEWGTTDQCGILLKNCVFLVLINNVNTFYYFRGTITAVRALVSRFINLVDPHFENI